MVNILMLIFKPIVSLFLINRDLFILIKLGWKTSYEVTHEEACLLITVVE